MEAKVRKSKSDNQDFFVHFDQKWVKFNQKWPKIG